MEAHDSPQIRDETNAMGASKDGRDAPKSSASEEHNIYGGAPHNLRRRAIAQAHPEVKDLAHPRPDSALLLWAGVGLQLLATWVVTHYQFGCLGITLVAFCFGAVVDHALWVLIHDCTHNLISYSQFWNKMYHCIGNLPFILPAAITFRRFHRQHHAALNDQETDASLPLAWEIKVFGWCSLGKLIWITLFPLLQIPRAMYYGRGRSVMEPFLAVNWIMQIAFTCAAYLCFGTTGIVYLLLSFFLSIGVHPLGARWIAEHHPIIGMQETYSYYGSFNVVALNVGYHFEHHDFPNVPWQNLPKLRQLAPEFYETLWYHTSYWKLILHFIFEPAFNIDMSKLRVTGVSYVKRDKESPVSGEKEDKSAVVPPVPAFRRRLERA